MEIINKQYKINSVVVEVDLTPIEDDVIKAAGWKNGFLILEFRTGEILAYSLTDKKLLDDLLSSDNKEDFYRKNVRDNIQYKFNSVISN